MEVKKGYKQTEIGVIPEDWEAVKIEVLIKKKDGIKIGPFGSQLKKELLKKHGYKVYGQENVYERNMESGSRYISKEHFHKLISCQIIPNDFLISMMGTIGKCLIAPYKFEKGIMDSHLLRLRLNNSIIENLFLLHYFSSQLLHRQIKRLSVGGIMEGLSSKIVRSVRIPLPVTILEQTAIATALSDTDNYILNLEKLIAKKRLIKEGAMQELLRPKEGWEEKRLGETLKIRHGKTQKKVISDKGIYPIYASGGIIGWANSYLYDKPSVLIGRKGTIDKPIFINIPFWSVDTMFYSEVNIHYDVKFLFYLFMLVNWYDYNEASGVPSLNAKTIENIIVRTPSKKQQEEIASILSSMDSEIESLEKQLAKARQIKQGMMQQLLTGKIRLV